MENLQRFMTYAGDFEKTLADDDWSRLRPYFADDAVYEVKGASFGCCLEGPEAIFVGMKKSLDGFDRKFAGRDLEVTEGPEIDGDEMRMDWRVVYHLEGWPPYVLRGSSTVRYRDGQIVHLCDLYDAEVEEGLRAWREQTGVDIDPSYT